MFPFAITLTGSDLVELLKNAPAFIVAITSLIVAIRAKRDAKEAARKQIHFALENAVTSGAITAPDDSPLRKEVGNVTI